MKWIGLTGGLGSGKSTVARIIREMGFSVLDADQMAHKSLTGQGPVIDQIRAAFGDQIFLPDGKLDRNLLGQIVFYDKEKLTILESIVHPAVRQMVSQERQRLEREGHELAFYDVPLLFEKSLEKNFDAIVVVYAPEEAQIERVMKRSSLTREEIVQRMKVQIPLDRKVGSADFVIDNSGDEAQLKAQVAQLLIDLKGKG